MLSAWSKEFANSGFGEFESKKSRAVVSYELTSTIDGRYRIEDFIVKKCPYITNRSCVLITNCISENCKIFRYPVGFFARLETDEPKASIQFNAFENEYIVLEPEG